jgi:hypothetical protein
MAATTFSEKTHIRDDYRQLHHINSMVFRVYVCMYIYGFDLNGSSTHSMVAFDVESEHVLPGPVIPSTL